MPHWFRFAKPGIRIVDADSRCGPGACRAYPERRSRVHVGASRIPAGRDSAATPTAATPGRGPRLVGSGPTAPPIRLSDAQRHVRGRLTVRDALVHTRTRYIRTPAARYEHTHASQKLRQGLEGLVVRLAGVDHAAVGFGRRGPVKSRPSAFLGHRSVSGAAGPVPLVRSGPAPTR